MSSSIGTNRNKYWCKISCGCLRRVGQHHTVIKLVALRFRPYVNETRFYLFRAILHAPPPLQMPVIFKIWKFYIYIMANFGDEGFRRERIDDDGRRGRGQALAVAELTSDSAIACEKSLRG
jgi:hypothetical protein